MKRLLASLLTAVLLITPLFGGAFAATDDDDDSRKLLSLSYEDVEGYIGNNELFNTETLYIYLSQLKASLDGYIKTVNNPSANPGTIASASASIAMTQSKMSDISSSIQTIGDSYDTLLMGAQKLYVSYNSLKDQVEELRRSLNVLNENYAAAQKQYELGLITELSLKNIQKNQDTLINSISTIQSQLKLMEQSFNIMVGRDYDARIHLKGVPNIDYKYISELKHNSDMEDAVAANKGTMSDEQFKASFEGLYKDVGQKKTALEQEQKIYELEKKNFLASQAQYDIGTLSKLGLVNAQDKLDAEAAKVRTAEINLFLAVENYKWAMDGVISK